MKYFSVILASLLLLASPALGQTTPKAIKPAAKATKTEAQPKTSDTVKQNAKTPKGLDSFFKAGEKQLKENGRCKKPPAPVA